MIRILIAVFGLTAFVAGPVVAQVDTEELYTDRAIPDDAEWEYVGVNLAGDQSLELAAARFDVGEI